MNVKYFLLILLFMQPNCKAMFLKKIKPLRLNKFGLLHNTFKRKWSLISSEQNEKLLDRLQMKAILEDKREYFDPIIACIKNENAKIFFKNNLLCIYTWRDGIMTQYLLNNEDLKILNKSANVIKIPVATENIVKDS